jgi:hypothetical protein
VNSVIGEFLNDIQSIQRLEGVLSVREHRNIYNLNRSDWFSMNTW